MKRRTELSLFEMLSEPGRDRRRAQAARVEKREEKQRVERGGRGDSTEAGLEGAASAEPNPNPLSALNRLFRRSAETGIGGIGEGAGGDRAAVEGVHVSKAVEAYNDGTRVSVAPGPIAAGSPASAIGTYDESELPEDLGSPSPLYSWLNFQLEVRRILIVVTGVGVLLAVWMAYSVGRGQAMDRVGVQTEEWYQKDGRNYPWAPLHEQTTPLQNREKLRNVASSGATITRPEPRSEDDSGEAGRSPAGTAPSKTHYFINIATGKLEELNKMARWVQSESGIMVMVDESSGKPVLRAGPYFDEERVNRDLDSIQRIRSYRTHDFGTAYKSSRR